MDGIGDTCKLCLKYVQGNNVAALDDDLLAKLEFIQMDLNRSVEDSNSLCTECKDKIENAFDFKSCLVQTESAKSVAPDSKAQNVCGIPSTSSGESSAEKTICRTCQSCVDVISVISLEKLLKDDNILEIFQGHIPELNLKETENSNVCERCQKSLASFSTLVSSWSIANDWNEDDEKEDMVGLEVVKVKQENVDDFSDSNTAIDVSNGAKIVKKAKGDQGQITNVKTESDEISDSSVSAFMNSKVIKKEQAEEENVQLKNEEVDIKDEDGTEAFALDDLLYFLSVTCKKPCGDYCICRKSGVKCSPMSDNCNGLSCLNFPTVNEEMDDLNKI